MRWPVWALASGSCTEHGEKGCPECSEPLNLHQFVPDTDDAEQSGIAEDAHTALMLGERVGVTP